MARATSTVRIGAHAFSAEPGETILQAAERAGLSFPYACRVGGCATCKCRVVEGAVHERTETGYLLSQDELQNRFVLGCQSEPRGDVTIDVALSAPQRVAGTVVGRRDLTADIAEILIRPASTFSFEPGQSARIAFADAASTARHYSLADAPRADGVLRFLVRRVAGGRLSPRLHGEAALGASVVVEGPFGDVRRRPDGGPCAFIATGSGIAPVIALLKAAQQAGEHPSVVVLHGAATEADLADRDVLLGLAEAWGAPFRYEPVLSRAEGSWAGHRGHVQDHLAACVPAGARAVVCGAPAMVDDVVRLLPSVGVVDVQADPFVAQPDPGPPELPVAALGPVAEVFHHLKYSLFHVLGAYSVGMALVGGRALPIGLLGLIAVYVAGDAWLGDDDTTPEYRAPRLLTWQLWSALPILALAVFVAVWHVATGDPLGFGALVHGWTGLDVLAARDATTRGQHVALGISTGLMIGLLGTITAHELTHRTWDPVSMFIGRWLLAFSFDTSFAIEHVYGHHRYVATLHDPATAPRGRSVYAHIVISTLRGNRSAWHIEADRLTKQGRRVWSVHNRFLRGHAMSLLLVGAAWAIGGAVGAAFFVACALWGKALLEIVNYMEHYGIVRDPGTPVQPRHSWNTNRRVSSWSMFNLTRHSHHHAQGEVPFHRLRPYPDAPMMLHGYLTTILIALVPPLWHAWMTPKVLAWDRDFASPDERRLAEAAGRASGMAAFRPR
jgi:NAD(P)H-flavin reductase/ferredoxin